MASDTVRIGIIGCGGIANVHARNLAGIPEARIVALADPNPENLKRFAERNPNAADAVTFSDYREMLESAELDAVEIASPHTAHFEQIMAAFDKGLHVLCEKPMVCSSDHARRVADAVGDKVLVVSYQRRYAPPFRYIREAIRSGRIGQVLFVSSLQSQNWYDAQRGQWRQTLSLSGGGQLNDSGSHMVDILLWMTGLRPKSVQAFIDNFDTEVDINSALSIAFEGGALGNVSVVGRSTCWWEDISIWGSEGALFMRNGKVTEVGKDGKPAEVDESAMPEGSNADRNFIDAILGRDVSHSTAEEATAVIGMTEAAWKSAESGRPEEVAYP